eukprot:5553880-Prymnesium_polylepis.1
MQVPLPARSCHVPGEGFCKAVTDSGYVTGLPVSFRNQSRAASTPTSQVVAPRAHQVSSSFRLAPHVVGPPTRRATAHALAAASRVSPPAVPKDCPQKPPANQPCTPSAALVRRALHRIPRVVAARPAWAGRLPVFVTTAIFLALQHLCGQHAAAAARRLPPPLPQSLPQPQMTARARSLTTVRDRATAPLNHRAFRQSLRRFVVGSRSSALIALPGAARQARREGRREVWGGWHKGGK